MAAVIAWRISVHRATFSFIASHEADNDEWRKIRRRFTEIASKDNHAEYLMSLLDPSTDEEWADRIVVASLLSHFEAVAVAIRHWTLSGRIYKDWNRSNFVRAWEKTESFVMETRKKTGRKSTWIHFERLAKKWNVE